MTALDNPSLVQLVYLSRRGDSISDQVVIDDIVVPAMRFNRSHDLTGCLWVGREHFVQVLEGPESEVDPLYGRIERDPRHHRVTLLEHHPISQREHSRFAMQLIRGDEHAEIDRVIARWAGDPADTRAAVRQEARHDDRTAATPVFRLAGRLRQMLAGRAAI